jgi:hypothetical protein
MVQDAAHRITGTVVIPTTVIATEPDLAVVDRSRRPGSVYAANGVVPDSQVYLALDARLTSSRHGHAAPENQQQDRDTALLTCVRAPKESKLCVLVAKCAIIGEAQSHAVTWALRGRAVQESAPYV